MVLAQLVVTPVAAYTASEVIAMITGAGVLVTAMGATVVNIIVALKTGKKMSESLQNQRDLSHQVQEVHTLTNSNLAAVKADLKEALAEMALMRNLIADLKSERDKLATVAAFNTPVVGPVEVLPISPEASEVFKSIETNTGNIDKNTQVLKDRNTADRLAHEKREGKK